MGFDWNPIHDVEQLASGAKNEFDQITSGAHTAPTPTVKSSAPAAVPPTVWTAPNVGASGHFHVHRDHLTTAADVIRASLPDLDAAINQVNSHTAAFSSLTTWPTGASLAGNMVAAVEGFARAGQDTSSAHGGAAQSLSASAAAYEEAETSNIQAARGVGGSQPSGSQPSAPAAPPAPPAPPSPAPSPAPSGGSAAGGKWS